MPRNAQIPSMILPTACPHCSRQIKHIGKHIKKYHPEKWKIQNPPIHPEKREKSEPFPSSETPSQADTILTPEIKELENTVLETEKTYNPEIQTEEELTTESEIKEELGTLLDPSTVQYITVVLFKTMARMSNQPLWELEKDEAKILMPPLTKVLNKYSPKLLKNYQDEVVLAATLGSIFLAKAQLIRAQKQNQDVNTNARRTETPTPTASLGGGGNGGGGTNFPKPEPLPKQAD